MWLVWRQISTFRSVKKSDIFCIPISWFFCGQFN